MIENDTHQIIIKVPPEEIVFIDQIFKSIGGLAMLNVDHDRKGVLYLDVTNGTHDRVKDILSDLNKKFPIKILEE